MKYFSANFAILGNFLKPKIKIFKAKIYHQFKTKYLEAYRSKQTGETKYDGISISPISVKFTQRLPASRALNMLRPQQTKLSQILKKGLQHDVKKTAITRQRARRPYSPEIEHYEKVDEQQPVSDDPVDETAKVNHSINCLGDSRKFCTQPNGIKRKTTCDYNVLKLN